MSKYWNLHKITLPFRKQLQVTLHFLWKYEDLSAVLFSTASEVTNKIFCFSIFCNLPSKHHAEPAPHFYCEPFLLVKAAVICILSLPHFSRSATYIFFQSQKNIHEISAVFSIFRTIKNTFLHCVLFVNVADLPVLILIFEKRTQSHFDFKTHLWEATRISFWNIDCKFFLVYNAVMHKQVNIINFYFFLRTEAAQWRRCRRLLIFVILIFKEVNDYYDRRNETWNRRLRPHL